MIGPGLPARPLWEAVRSSGKSLPTVAEAAGVSERTLTRLKLRGQRITSKVADHVCLALGLHPAMLWREW